MGRVVGDATRANIGAWLILERGFYPTFYIKES